MHVTVVVKPSSRPLHSGYENIVKTCEAWGTNQLLSPSFRNYAEVLARMAKRASSGINFLTLSNVVDDFSAKCERYIAEHTAQATVPAVIH